MKSYLIYEVKCYSIANESKLDAINNENDLTMRVLEYEFLCNPIAIWYSKILSLEWEIRGSFIESQNQSMIVIDRDEWCRLIQSLV